MSRAAAPQCTCGARSWRSCSQAVPRSICRVGWLMPKRSSSSWSMAIDEGVVVVGRPGGPGARSSRSRPRPATRCAGGAPRSRRAARRGRRAPAPGRCWRGTASIAALKLSRSRPKAPNATTAPTSSAVSGSSQRQPSHQHARAGEHRRQRHRRIGDQVQERAAAVEVVVPVAHEPRRAEVDRDADRGDHHHRQRRDFRRRAEAPHRFPAQRAGERHQQHAHWPAARAAWRGASRRCGVSVGGRLRDHRRAPGQRRGRARRRGCAAHRTAAPANWSRSRSRLPAPCRRG